MIGVIIVAGETQGWYSLEGGYQMVMVLAISLLTLSGLIMQWSTIGNPHLTALVVRNPSPAWNWNRVYYLIYDTVMGVNFFLPGILVLTLIGNETVLGTLQSLVAFLSAVVVYVLGRKLVIEKIPTVLFIAVCFYFLAALALAAWYASWSALLFIAVTGGVYAIRFAAGYTVSMEVIDAEVKRTGSQGHYAYVCDNELFFNLGRVLGIGVFAVIMVFISQAAALRYVPLLVVTLQFVGLYPMKKMVAHVQQSQFKL